MASEKESSEQQEDKRQAAIKRRAKKKNVPVGVVYIHATFNNTIISITDLEGKVVSWSSPGCHGFKGSRKSTPFAAQVAAAKAAEVAIENGMRSAHVFLRGPGSGRESAVRALQIAGLNISVIKDITPVPHNGCRAEKRRRV